MHRFRHLLWLLILLSPLAGAMNAVFWQPQLRDSSVSAPQWQSLMKTLYQTGFDTLVLQWTQYGDAFNDKEQRQSLQQRVDAARAAGLKVIIGLHGDPAFFQRQMQPAAALEHYLGRLRVSDIKQARAWANRADGWYISAEIDDLNWRNSARRERLLAWLDNTRMQLASISSRPVYISSFFAGNMTPEGYRQLLEDIRRTGIAVWVQDGRGVNKLTAVERQRYLDLSAGCKGQTPASGVVYELFQVIPDKRFRARALADGELAEQLAQKPACAKDRLYFSLRYLPAAHGIMAVE